MLVTAIWKVAVPPGLMFCDFGSFRIEIAGCETAGAGCVLAGLGLTVTWAVSLAVTSGPVGGVPTSTATFVKFVVTFVSAH